MSIILKNVTAGYKPGYPVLKDLSFEISSGQRFCLLGNNGCGKTTLFRVLTGIIPYSGSIRINGRELSSLKRTELSQKLSMLSQLSGSWFSYTVYDTVKQGRYLYSSDFLGRLSPSDLDAVDEALEAVGISHLKDSEIHSLSGGQLQRVYLARTLAQGTDYILLDEPGNHLDLKAQADMSDYLLKWSEEENHTLIGIYHDLLMAANLGEKFAILKEGRLLACPDKSELLSCDALKEAFGMDVASYIKTRTESLFATTS